jgi:tetratricopeptide (TPR) repeat protein
VVITPAGPELDPFLPRGRKLVDQIERDALRRYMGRQFVILTQRHSPEDAILVRVISDYHQHVVSQAKQGNLNAARSTLRALQKLARLDEAELLATHWISALPAEALIHWYEGNYHEAIRLLRLALEACFELSTRFAHDYLTGKRINLASNTARVLVSLGDFDQALTRANALRGVIAGERVLWPFEGAESLNVPVNYPERLLLEDQLSRIAFLATKASGGGER